MIELALILIGIVKADGLRRCVDVNGIDSFIAAGSELNT